MPEMQCGKREGKIHILHVYFSGMEMETIVLILLAVVIVALLLLALRRLYSSAGADATPSLLADLEKDIERTERSLRDEFARIREEMNHSARGVREEVASTLKTTTDMLADRVTQMGSLQGKQLETFSNHLGTLTQSVEQKLEGVRGVVEERLKSIQEDNTRQLEQMRATVDEKLHTTLEKRLGDSFQLITERLEKVYQELGQMKSLSTGVEDLKKVLSNVKTRGAWGEVQLGNLLEQIFSPEQYATNVVTKQGSSERVEFAIKLPGRNEDEGPLYLPIDAKFPLEDYQRLVVAQEQADLPGIEEAGKALEVRIKQEAKDIKEKYLDPPHTTDFGILFLPIEGLYAEVLRRPGLAEMLQREYRVSLAGPTTLMAFINSLQMGFRTLAIEKRSSEVWRLLGAIKTEFGKFGDLLDKTHKKLTEATDSLDTAAKKTRTIERKLRSVQELPAAESAKLLPEANGEEEV